VVEGVTELQDRLEAAGYFPQLAWEVIDVALGDEPVDAALVQRAPTLTPGSAGSHLTVVVLTPTRLLFTHIDDQVADGPEATPSTAATTDAIALAAIDAVGLTHMVADAGAGPERSVTMAMSWGAPSHLDIAPAFCPDPGCEADHGYTGTINSDDLAIRVSEAADGAGAVADLLSFARCLSTACARARS
jgi:hypothetical protein